MSVLAGLPNAFEEPNWVWCFNHTLQLSAKALLKPFYSAGLLDTDIDSDDGILVLQAADDEEEENEDENEDGMDDDKDKEEEEDPFTILDNNKREILIQNTEAVHTTLMKVCMFLLFVFFFCAHLCCCSRFANSPSPLSIPPPLPFLHGLKPMPLTPYLYSLSLMMSKLNGILHTICWT